MLWLAGIMGLMGVGAASFAAVHLQEDDEEEDFDALEQDTQANGDLLDQIKDIQAPSAPGIFSMMKDSGGTHQEPVTADDADYQFFDEDTLDAEETASPLGMTDTFFQTDETIEEWEHDPLYEEAGDHDQTPFADFSDLEPETVQNALAGDWINRGGPSEILDYETGKESLMLVWDDMAENASEPACDVTSDPYDDEVKHVMMNGKSVAEVYGDPDLSVEDVTVIPLSSALIAGLEPAQAS